MFSILIPTWNNLELLKLCVRSIRENSSLAHQIIVHVNDGSDGSLEWVRTQQLPHTHSPQNVGICLAVNEAAMLAQHDYILYLNDDMYCCPGWDTALVNKMKGLDTDLFMLSGTMIEPVQTSNPCVIVKDYGRSPDQFAEQELLANLPSHHTVSYTHLMSWQDFEPLKDIINSPSQLEFFAEQPLLLNNPSIEPMKDFLREIVRQALS